MTLCKPLDRSLYADLVGKPFVLRARGPEAYDCFGLVMEIFTRQGIAMNDHTYGESLRSQMEAFQNGQKHSQWIKLDAPEPGCALMFAYVNLPGHAGVMIDGSRFIHATATFNQVVISRITDGIPTYASKLLGAYRYAV